ncbi:uncharacterized protein LOC5573897 [Aedes aegypti]|uniref:Uncharacterized protein n=1 Tax=Aedes aegypti TaxID=7159 RepID=A0A1S4F0Z3_AEDAE|nr:uncharacterized protein LOC5573897 [Aedes aegypti]
MASMKLVVIHHTDWPKLRDLFLNGNEIPFNAVQNCINWRVRDPEIQHLQILGLGETWRENGTFILRDRHELYFFTLEQSNESLEHVLELINWSSSYRIVGITKQNQTALESVLTRMNKLSSEEHLMEADLYVKVLNKKEIDVEPPLGFRLGSLETCHAPYLNALSDYPNSKSEFTISRYITWNPNVALFNEHDELVAWCLLNNLGIIRIIIKGIVEEGLRR